MPSKQQLLRKLKELAEANAKASNRIAYVDGPSEACELAEFAVDNAALILELVTHAETPPAGPFNSDTVVCRRYTQAHYPGQNFYHYDLQPAFNSVPVKLGDLIFVAEGMKKWD